MKKMTCKQLGGACDAVFEASTFEAMAEQSKNHGIAMQGDAAHVEAMKKMIELMQKPEKIQEWMQEKKKAFDDLEEE